MSNAIPKFNPAVFLKEVRAELLKVNWPNRGQVTRLTLIVIGASATMALLIGGLDLAFTQLMQVLVK